MTNSETAKTRALRVFSAIVRARFVRELLIVLVFALLTAVMTWPYVTRLRDAVAGPGDPYLVTWALWWDYHQTFTDPLNLFHANVFYPYRYTLAFTEHSYGLALLCFPLFAVGLKPLTVHAVAMFFGFALSGYGAFRLARTLTGSNGVAWVAGVLFAFVPYRFTMMAQLMYLFSPWIPLLFEALVLFLRKRSWQRATWLGVAFFMTGLTTVSWLLLSLIPLALAGAILLSRYELWRDRALWRRAIVSLGVASLALLPFMVPYYLVSRLYGFQRSVDDVRTHSAMPYHWLVAEGRNKLWARLGEKFPEAWKFQMFPGLLALLFPLGEFLLTRPTQPSERKHPEPRSKWVKSLDIAALVLFALSIPALGFDTTDAFGKIFLLHIRSDRTLMLLTIAIIARFCLAYPKFLRRDHANLIETIKSPHRSEAFWVGLILTVIGFFYSIGWNSFFYRFLYELVPGFKSIRAPMRGAMFACLGLALLSGLGAKRIGEFFAQRWPRVRPSFVYGACCLLLLTELNCAPLTFMRGEVFPDAVTLRLRDTPMRGGIAYLPLGVAFNQRYMLRAADHMKPLILGTSGFTPPLEDQLESLTKDGPIKPEFMDLLERIPASYLVVCNQSIAPEHADDYHAFLITSLKQGRLRFINRFDARDDLYAIVKTEPAAQTEGVLPFKLVLDDWAKKLNEEPANLLSLTSESQTLYRLEMATTGTMPRYAEFMASLKAVAAGVLLGSDLEHDQFQKNLLKFADELARHDRFRHLDDAQFIDRVLQNADLSLDPQERAKMIAALGGHEEKRAAALVDVVMDPRFVDKEFGKSVTLLTYFAYLRRNPDDPPDHDLTGFNFWLNDFERYHDGNRLAIAFKRSIEYGEQRKTSP